MENTQIEMTPLRLSREAWQEHIQQWQSRSMPIAQYCRETGLSTHQFMYWRRRLRSTPTGFIQVEPLRPAPAELWLEWGTRHRLRIGRDFDAQTLRQILELTDAP